MPVAPADMGRWSLAAAAVAVNGKPEFVLLADAVDALGGGHAEDLQDIDCAGPP
jgi:CDP-diacylglycerol pyrophosphatase